MERVPFPIFGSNYRSLSASVFNLLQSVVLEPEQGPPKLRLLAATVLRELAPTEREIVREFGPPVEERNLQYMLPVLLAQGGPRLGVLTASHIFRCALSIYISLNHTHYLSRVCVCVPYFCPKVADSTWV